jgi:Mrp family chromosome partitioning ATPase
VTVVDADTPATLVGSGKGGVGKTLFSTGLTWALAGRCRPGLLDADVRSPNVTKVLRLNGCKPDIDDRGVPAPVTGRVGDRTFPVFSTAMAYAEGRSLIMGGDMVRRMVFEMLFDVRWPELDGIVVDMDPSTGDTLRALADSLRHVNALLVSTSDVSSLSDCARMADGFGDYGVRVLGVVGNMVGARCPSCGTAIHYGERAPIEDLARQHGLRYLGGLPWDPLFQSDPMQAVQTVGRDLFDDLARLVVGGE